MHSIDDFRQIHIMEEQRKEDEMLEILYNENKYLDEVAEDFKATPNEEDDVHRLYGLLHFNESRCLGTMTPENTRKFYSKALYLRAKEHKNPAVANVFKTLADHLEIPLKLPE